MVERPGMLPAGARGTEREVDDIDDDPELLEPRVDEDPSYDRILLCGGRGT
jgi:hypothetical protein